jgi:threonine/homoserine/homoserine lactone efflux protein
MSIAWALFIPSCFALNMAPGPNNLLSVNNAARFGFTAACLGTLGRLVAFAGMLVLAGSGLALVLLTSAWLFTAIKLTGAFYLIWIAIQLWTAKPMAGGWSGQIVKTNLWGLMRQEFLVAAGNPKAILVFTAFLPQFVVTGEPLGPQFTQLGTAFLIMECFAIAIYAFAGVRLGRLLAGERARRLFNRGCAALLGSAGIGLLLSRRPA